MDIYTTVNAMRKRAYYGGMSGADLAGIAIAQRYYDQDKRRSNRALRQLLETNDPDTANNRVMLHTLWKGLKRPLIAGALGAGLGGAVSASGGADTAMAGAYGGAIGGGAVGLLASIISATKGKISGALNPVDKELVKRVYTDPGKAGFSDLIKARSMVRKYIMNNDTDVGVSGEGVNSNVNSAR